MTGGYESILGVKEECILQKFLSKMPVRFEQAEGDCQFNAVIIEFDNNSYKVTSIERIFDVY